MFPSAIGTERLVFAFVRVTPYSNLSSPPSMRSALYGYKQNRVCQEQGGLGLEGSAWPGLGLRSRVGVDEVIASISGRKPVKYFLVGFWTLERECQLEARVKL